MNPPDDNRELLSEAGTARRQAILADAVRLADRMRRKRLAARVSATVCFAALAAATVVILQRRDEGGSTSPDDRLAAVDAGSLRRAPSPPRDTAAEIPPSVVVQVIRAGDVQPRWETLSDDQFLAAMADAGRPSGFVQLNGRAVVVPVQ